MLFADLRCLVLDLARKNSACDNKKKKIHEIGLKRAQGAIIVS
jgi:hypothetical protein